MNRITAIGAAVLSGLGVYLAFSHRAPFLVWITLVPLFLALEGWGAQDRSRRSNGRRVDRFLPAFVAAATFSVFAFAWMIPGAHAFTGAAVGYGIAIFVICVMVYSLGCAVLLAWTPGVLVAPVWILAETLLQWTAVKMPWFLFHIGNALATGLVAIQPISVIGVTGAGFVVILVNYGLAQACLHRSWRRALAPVLLLGIYFAWGWWLLPPEEQLAPSLDRRTPSLAQRAPSFLLAIVKENIPPEIPWDSTNGNGRVQQLLQEEDSCIATGAGMLLWSESALPWTYSPDDDLVMELLRHSGSREGARGPARPEVRPIIHLLGMNTAVSAGVVRNSAYCLFPDGRVAGRYDKHDPLLFIEQPALGWQFPFFSSDGYSVEPGESEEPLPTPYGKAGVLICNESALPGAAAVRVREGAQFLLNMSNDGWFRDTWLIAQHFYNARLRAVETRKDLVINSNNGWSGCIHASGRVDTASRVFAIHPNDLRPVAVRYPLLPAVGCLLFVLFVMGTAPGGFRKFINNKTRLL